MTPTRYSRSRRSVLRAGTALAAAALAGCSGDGDGGDPRTVAMTDGFAFDPETVRIASGETVRWVNESEVGHTVTAYGDRLPDGAAYFASGGFDTEAAARGDVNGGLIGPDESYEHTFERAGTYDYYCIPHEGSGMIGTVRVK